MDIGPARDERPASDRYPYCISMPGQTAGGARTQNRRKPNRTQQSDIKKQCRDSKNTFDKRTEIDYNTIEPRQDHSTKTKRHSRTGS